MDLNHGYKQTKGLHEIVRDLKKDQLGLRCDALKFHGSLVEKLIEEFMTRESSLSILSHLKKFS